MLLSKFGRGETFLPHLIVPWLSGLQNDYQYYFFFNDKTIKSAPVRMEVFVVLQELHPVLPKTGAIFIVVLLLFFVFIFSPTLKDKKHWLLCSIESFISYIIVNGCIGNRVVISEQHLSTIVNV